MLPCLLFEDDHLLVVDKPAGLNTHAPSPYAGEGIYDWLRHREPRWATLAIIHRLDKETSGVILFGKTPLANRSLTEQFSARDVRKKYLLLADGPVKRPGFTVKTSLVRIGEKYASRPGGEAAETHFRVLETRAGRTLVEAEPRTGRTHQIRVHAAESGFPILGDTLYGGSPAERVFLHAAELRFHHPATGAPLAFSAPSGFPFPRS
jgi:RluA family pseudouridine synthase